MSFIKFDLNEFNKIVSDASAKIGNKINKNDYTKTSYLPEGIHTLTFFFDPDKEIFRDVAFHKPNGSKIKCHCPNKLNKLNERNPKWKEFVQSLKPEWKDQNLSALPACEICSINADAQQLDIDKYGDVKKGKSWKEKLGIDYKTLMYVNLYETTNPGEYWKPDAVKGTPYAVIGTSKLKASFVKMLETYSKNERARSEIIASLNPSIPTPPCEVHSTRGVTGSTVIQRPPADEKAAIIESAANLPAWWRPLTKVFLSETFVLEDYEMNVKAAQDILAKMQEEYSDQPNVPPAPVEKKSTSPLQINGKGGQEDSFLASKGSATAEVDEPVYTRNQVEDPKPLTHVEEVAQTKGILADNQRLTKMDNVVTLPDFAVERNCWSNYQPLDALCMKCPAALECSFEQ